MGTNCVPLVADLFLFCYERDFMVSLSDEKQADVIDAFNTIIATVVTGVSKGHAFHHKHRIR